MNKPRIATYLLGNSPVAYALIGAFAVAVYLWWVGRLGGEVAFVALIFAASAHRAHEQLTRYRRWQAEWESYSASGPDPSPASKRGPSVWQLMLLGLIATWGYLLTTVKPGQPNTAFVYATFALVGFGIGSFLWTMMGAWRRRRQATAHKPDYDLVAVCAPVAATPTLHDAYRQLPDYCYRLFPTSGKS